jgi:mono/diheme cytochrome c family protein
VTSPRAALVIAATLAPWLLAGCENRPAVRTGFDPGPVPAELAEGERLYLKNCARCHGQQGVGSGVGPPLIHIVYEPNHHGDMAFQRAAKFGVPAHHWTFGNMPPIPEVDEAAVAQITAYVRWLQRAAGIH